MLIYYSSNNYKTYSLPLKVENLFKLNKLTSGILFNFEIVNSKLISIANVLVIISTIVKITNFRI